VHPPTIEKGLVLLFRARRQQETLLEPGCRDLLEPACIGETRFPGD